MNKFFLLIGLFFFFGQSLEAQSEKAYRKKAEEKYEAGDFAAAYQYYSILVEADSTNIDALYYSGLSALKMDAYPVAESLFDKVLRHTEAASKPDVYFHQAIAKKYQMKYDEAIHLFTEIINTNADPVAQENALKEIEAAEWSMEQIADSDSLSIQSHAEVNTVYSDFAPFWYENALYYTSVTAPVDSNNLEDFQPLTKVYKYDDGAPQGFTIAGNATDPSKHTAHFALSLDGKRQYINFCDQKTPIDFHCKLFYYETLSDNSSSLVEMPAHINNDDFTTTEPTVGIDDNGNEVLYFVSDRPGGKGGMDIWFTTRDADGNYSQPENLEALNTEGDDITPFFHVPSKSMFFSSEGRQNMGNFDIYKATWKGYEWTDVEHTGFPLNGGYDDVYFSFDSERAMGAFASNRPGCLCSSADNICVCNDIYTYPITVGVNTLVFNKLDDSELLGATVKLIDLTTGEVVDMIPNLSANDFNFPLKLEKTYRLVGYKEGWAADSIEFNTKGIFLPKTFDESLKLTPSVKLEVLVFDALTKKPLNGANINFLELGGIPFDRENDEGNDFYYDLEFGKEYKITGNKEGYTFDAQKFSTVDLKSPQTIRKNLYLTPFAGKLALYFDNDYPKYPTRPKNVDTTANFYGETFEAYYAKKDIFIREYSKNRSDIERSTLDKSLNDFFENEVKANYLKLNEYCRLLSLYLRENPEKTFEVLMEGFASPLAKEEYNFHLTNRRTICVINHFRNYEGGVLKQYMGGAAPRLRFTRVANGETRSAPVDDNRANPRESIFSRKASVERRVQISGIREYSPSMSWFIDGVEITPTHFR